VAPDKNADERLNLVLASGDYPDIILGFGMSNTQVLMNGQQTNHADNDGRVLSGIESV
jgi:putative aldouronate transport system substrate-binding protein